MSTSKFVKAIVLAVCAIMVVQPLFIPLVESKGPTGSRASNFFVWGTPVQITHDGGAEHVGQMGVDSQGNLHCVWMNETGTIFYGKTDPNGTFIGTPRVLGTSNRLLNANPRLNIDEMDQVHITWSNDSGPQLNRVYEYDRLSSGAIIANQHGRGGDAIVGNSTGFAALRFYNASGPSAKTYGPLSLLFYDSAGFLLKNLTVGYHLRTFEQASMIRNTTGDIFIVYMMNQTVMNLTKVVGQSLSLNQSTLLTGRANLASPRLQFDNEGKLQLVWIDGIKNAAYQDAGIYSMRLGTDGTVLRSPGLLVTADRDTYRPDELAIVNTKGYPDFPVLAKGHYTDMGSGGSELPEFYLLAQVKTDGTVLSSKSQFMFYCSGNTPTMAQGGSGIYYMSYGRRDCWNEGGSNSWRGDLFFLKSYGYHTIDLSIRQSDVRFPARTFPGEDFQFNVTVRNLGDWKTTDFVLNITDKTSSQPVQNATWNLSAGANRTFSFKFNLNVPVTYHLHLDPMKNLDANMSNNDLDFTITPVPRPDLEISSENITFTNIRPRLGQTTQIMAHISNLGGPGVKADVLSYDGINGTFIGKSRLDFNTSFTISTVFWTPKHVGIRTVFMEITNITPAELPGHDTNNQATTQVLVGSLTVPSIVIASPVNGTTIEAGKFNITGQAWDPDGDILDVFVRLDGGQWEEVAMRSNSTLKGLDWFIVWDFTDVAEGNHSLMAQVKDDIHQNTTVTVIKLVKYLVPFLVINWTPKKDPTINETEWVNFGVTIKNPHALNISYSWAVDGEMLGNNTSRFNLTTNSNSAGVYNVTVKVANGKTIWTHSWKVTVVHKNMPPVIKSFSPTDDNISLKQLTTVTFEIKASDPEADKLNYTWTTGGTIINITNGTASIKFPKEGDFFVNVTVSDGKGGIANHSWKVHYKYMKPPCCGPPPKYQTAMDNAVWIFIVVVGIIAMTCIIVIYVRLGRMRKDGEETQTDEESRLPGRRI